MPKKLMTLLDIHNLFDRGRVYVIRNVQDDCVAISRLRRRRGHFIVSDYFFERRVGRPEMRVKASPGDLAYKGYGMRWKLIRKVFRRDIAEE